MLPANERLESVQDAVVERHDVLIEEHELTPFERAFEIVLQLEQRCGLGQQFGRK